jgi:hypothetical protein
VVLLLSVSPAFTVENVLVRQRCYFEELYATITAHCVQHYEEGLKPEAVAKLRP